METSGSFGAVLREYRLAAGLTQEVLAERAGVSARNIQHLERGENRPLKDTARRLAAALGLDDRDRTLLMAASRPRPRRRAPTPPVPPTADQAGSRSPATPTPAVPAAVPLAARHNLPAALSSFIGREGAQARVHERLAASRLVTLTGIGGVGKTRLALAVAEGLVDQYADGVWWVELAPLADPAQVPWAVATTLGVREEAGRAMLATLATHLAAKQVLLVLDNCEHLVGGCAELAGALLRVAPGLRILATSREGLGVAGERRYRVPVLSSPDLRHLPPAELVGSFEAVRLFVERARERRDDFTLTGGNARAVAELCARLDGVPLAIELAAARSASMAVEAITARLGERFRLLTGAARDLPARHRTLRAALDWSWDLLGAEERALLARLSVFAGGWALEAAEVVCIGDGLEAWSVLDGLDGLVGKSLVQVDESGEGAGRYRLLETVRQYAAERLEERGEEAAVRDCHLGWCVALAEAAASHLTGAAQGAWLDRLDTEHDNLRAALGWARGSGAADQGMRLAGALWRFWRMRGHISEGRGWLEGLLAGGGSAPAATRVAALLGAGFLAFYQDAGRATTLFEEALARSRVLGNRGGIASALHGLGQVAYKQDDYPRAAALLEEALALYRGLGEQDDSAAALRGLGLLAAQAGDYGRATTLLEEALALCRAMSSQSNAAYVLCDLGSVARLRGDHERALALYSDALVLQRALGDKGGIARSLDNLGIVAQLEGDHGRALALHEEALTLQRALGDEGGIARSLGNLGIVAQLQGDHGRALALYEEALALQRALHDRWGRAWLLGLLGGAACVRGDYRRAGALCTESLLLSSVIKARDLLPGGLEGLAWVAAAHGQAERAARLGGAAQALREALGVPLPPELRAGHDQAVPAIRAALGAAQSDAVWAEGRAMPSGAAVALALGADCTSAE